MISRRLSETEKIGIIKECTETKKRLNTIAKEHNITVEDIYQIIEDYCKDNDYTTFVRRKGTFEKKDRTVVKIEEGEEVVVEVKGKSGREILNEEYMAKSLGNVKEIEEWFYKNDRLPRNYISGVTAAKTREEETAEQTEMRLGRAFTRIKTKYQGIYLNDIEDERIRDIVRRIRLLERVYKRRLKYQEAKKTENKSGNKIDIVQKYGKEEIRKRIREVGTAKGATEEEILEVEKFYGINSYQRGRGKDENYR